jgi:DNA polymerase III subunit beta
MKLLVSKDAILDGLQKVQSIVGTKTTLPILYNVFFKAEKDRLWLTATDLEVTVRTAVEAKIARQGGTTLPAKRIFSIFRELPANEIEIDVDDRDAASIKAGPSFFKIIGISEDEFPPLPKYDGGRQLTIEQGTLRSMLASTHYAASTEEARYILNGVLLSMKGDKVTVVATDGRRMALEEREIEFPKECEGDAVIPTKTVMELLRTLGDAGTVKVQIASNQAAFEFDNMLIVSKLIDGTFPNFRQVIPAQCEERVTIEREQLFDAVRRVSLLASDKASSVTLSFGKNKLEIVVVAAEIGEAKETLPIKYSGKDIAISFNPDFVLDPLRNLTSDEISFELSDELSPGVMKCDRPFICMLMPMRVR